MVKEKYVISEFISFSHPLSMIFTGKKWYDDDEYQWCDNRTYIPEIVNAIIYIFPDGKCTLNFHKRDDYFVEKCKKQKMMCRTKFNSIKELIKYFLTDPLFELPSKWQDYMNNYYHEVKKYYPQSIKRHLNIGYNKFKFTEYRGEFKYYDKDVIDKFGNVCPLPEGMRSWGHEYDVWSETHGYIEIGEHYSWYKTLDNYIVYNIKDHDVDFCIEKYFDDFYITNELAFYNFIKNIDPTLNHSEVYNYYRKSFNSYKDGLTYNDKNLNFDEVFSTYVSEKNKAEQIELDDLNRQIAELQAKRNNFFKNYE